MIKRLNCPEIVLDIAYKYRFFIPGFVSLAFILHILLFCCGYLVFYCSCSMAVCNVSVCVKCKDDVKVLINIILFTLASFCSPCVADKAIGFVLRFDICVMITLISFEKNICDRCW